MGGNSPGDKNVSVVFEFYEVNAEYLTHGYQEVSCHIIFYVKMG